MFLDDYHQSRFLHWQDQLPERYRQDREHLSLIFLFTGNEELERKIKKYYDPREGNFYIDDIFREEDFSGGLTVLMRLAAVIFNQGAGLDISALSRLDARNLDLAINTIKLRYQVVDLTFLQQFQSEPFSMKDVQP